MDKQTPLLRETLLTKYSNFIKPDPDEQRNLMKYGFCCGDGWLPILEELFEEINKLELPEDFELFQVKEKFGELRVYTEGANDEIFELIEKYTEKSDVTCERCGREGRRTIVNHWLATLCLPCETEGRR